MTDAPPRFVIEQRRALATAYTEVLHANSQLTRQVGSLAEAFRRVSCRGPQGHPAIENIP